MRRLERTMTMRAARARRKVTRPTNVQRVKSTEHSATHWAVHIAGYLASRVAGGFVFILRRFCGSFFIGVLHFSGAHGFQGMTALTCWVTPLFGEALLGFTRGMSRFVDQFRVRRRAMGIDVELSSTVKLHVDWIGGVGNGT